MQSEGERAHALARKRACGSGCRERATWRDSAARSREENTSQTIPRNRSEMSFFTTALQDRAQTLEARLWNAVGKAAARCFSKTEAHLKLSFSTANVQNDRYINARTHTHTQIKNQISLFLIRFLSLALSYTHTNTLTSTAGRRMNIMRGSRIGVPCWWRDKFSHQLTVTHIYLFCV